MTRHLHARRLALVSLVGAVASVTFASAASAAWTKPGTGSGTSTAGSLTAPTGVTVSSPSTGTVTVSWTAGTAPAGAAITYLVERKSGATYTAAGGTCASPAISPCNDTGVANGTYQYRVTTKVGSNWVKPSTDSGSVTTAVALTVTAPTNGATTDRSPTFTGKAAVGATVTVNIYVGTNTSGTAIRSLTATADASGDWSTSVPGNNGSSGRLASNTSHTAVISDGTTTINRTFTTDSNN